MAKKKASPQNNNTDTPTCLCEEAHTALKAALPCCECHTDFPVTHYDGQNRTVELNHDGTNYTVTKPDTGCTFSTDNEAHATLAMEYFCCTTQPVSETDLAALAQGQRP